MSESISTAVFASLDFDAAGHEELLQELARLMRMGLSCWVEDGQLQLSGARALVDEGLVETLREHKQLVIDWLRAEGFEDRYYPLSFGQRRLWYLHSLSADNRRALNVTFAFGIRGEFDLARAQLALEELLRRQSSLRTAYHLRLHEPMQTLVSEVTLPLVIQERGHLPSGGSDQLDALCSDVNQIAIQQSAIEFDLENPPLIRASILRYAADLHAVVISLHHIACDGWSLGVLFRDFIAIYLRDFIASPIDLPVLERTYADFACDQLQRFDAAESQRQLDFWRESLAGVDHELNLRPDFPRPAEQSRRGAREIVHLGADLLEALQALSQKHETTLFTTLLTCYGIMLHQQSGQRDFVVGTDVANRNSAADADLVGFFVNVVPVRAQFKGDPRFTELLALSKRRLMAQMPYQEFPLERMVEGLKIPRSATQSPLVQALFVLQNTFKNTLSIEGLEPFDLPVGTDTTRFDLALFATETESGLQLEWNYCTDLFKRERILAMSESFKSNLRHAVESPESRLTEFDKAEASQNTSGGGKKNIRSKLSKLRKSREDRRHRPVALINRRFLDASEAIQWVKGFPLVYEPAHRDVDLLTWAHGNVGTVQDDLSEHGALLLRGFDVDTVEAFEGLAQTVCPTLFGEYGDLPKADGGKRIYRSTPYPSDRAILYHNESSHMQVWPRSQFFYCLQPSAQGGATPVVDTRAIYRAMPLHMRDEFERRGLCYTRNFTPRLDVSWQDYFKVESGEEVERKCREKDIDFSWLDDGTLRTREFAPAVRVHPKTGEKTFFNQIQLHHVSCLDDDVRRSLNEMLGEEGMPRNVYFGDGEPIPDDWVTQLVQLYEAHALRFKWQRGDILMLDNMSMAHGRDPYEGDRSIRVAMGQMMSNTDYQQALLTGVGKQGAAS